MLKRNYLALVLCVLNINAKHVRAAQKCYAEWFYNQLFCFLLTEGRQRNDVDQGQVELF